MRSAYNEFIDFLGDLKNRKYGATSNYPSENIIGNRQVLQEIPPNSYYNDQNFGNSIPSMFHSTNNEQRYKNMNTEYNHTSYISPNNFDEDQYEYSQENYQENLDNYDKYENSYNKMVSQNFHESNLFQNNPSNYNEANSKELLNADDLAYLEKLEEQLRNKGIENYLPPNKASDLNYSKEKSKYHSMSIPEERENPYKHHHNKNQENYELEYQVEDKNPFERNFSFGSFDKLNAIEKPKEANSNIVSFSEKSEYQYNYIDSKESNKYSRTLNEMKQNYYLSENTFSQQDNYRKNIAQDQLPNIDYEIPRPNCVIPETKDFPSKLIMKPDLNSMITPKPQFKSTYEPNPKIKSDYIPTSRKDQEHKETNKIETVDSTIMKSNSLAQNRELMLFLSHINSELKFCFSIDKMKTQFTNYSANLINLLINDLKGSHTSSNESNNTKFGLDDIKALVERSDANLNDMQIVGIMEMYCKDKMNYTLKKEELESWFKHSTGQNISNTKCNMELGKSLVKSILEAMNQRNEFRHNFKKKIGINLDLEVLFISLDKNSKGCICGSDLHSLFIDNKFEIPADLTTDKFEEFFPKMTYKHFLIEFQY